MNDKIKIVSNGGLPMSFERSQSEIDADDVMVFLHYLDTCVIVGSDLAPVMRKHLYELYKDRDQATLKHILEYSDLDPNQVRAIVSM